MACRPACPVIDARGLIGQITRVQPLTAEVTLLIERNHPVPVMVQRNGLRAVMYGMGGQAEIRHIAAHADVQVGDMLVTSGIDGIYPAGLPVAESQHGGPQRRLAVCPHSLRAAGRRGRKPHAAGAQRNPEPAAAAGTCACAQGQIPPQTWK